MPFIVAFEVAAPEMFATAAGAEFGTAAAFDALGAETLGAGALGLEGLGAGALGLEGLGGFGLEGISGAAPSMLEGITAGGAGAGEVGVNAAQVAAQQEAATAAANSGITQATNSGFSQAELEAMQRGQEIAQTSSAAPPLEQTAYRGTGSMLDKPYDPKEWEALKAENLASRSPIPLVDAAPPVATPAAPPVATPANGYGITGSGPNIPNPNYSLPSPSNVGGEGLKLGSRGLPTGGVDMGGAGGVSGTFPTASSTQSGFMKGVGDVLDWADKNPFKAGIGAYMGAQKLGLFDQKKQQVGEDPYKGGILQNYKMSPDFKGRFANPQDFQYTPKVYNMAEGGIASYRAGGDTLSDQLSYFESLRQGQTSSPPSGKTAPHGDHGDVGIYYDLDPDTRYQDALTAAQIRQAKVNKRANMQLPSMQRPTPMGQLNLAPPGVKAQDSGVMTEAAQGGIMSLGGYAAGGNPRLLKGPGDGMSDNIPATIANKQPARLADGEFVVPADVVSHLGNGSTDAGAKRLHEMMTKVRKERTGNPKQGKQINPNKYMPT